MKIMNPILAMMMFFVVIQLSSGEKLQCSEFKDQSFYLVGTYYACAVTSLENHCNSKIITGYTGQPRYNSNDVKAIYIHHTNTKFIPANLGLLFVITAFYMEKTQLVEIKAKDFNDMNNLEVLSLHANELTSLPLDAFSKLGKLRIIILSENHIGELSDGLFSNNQKLEQLYISNSKIKFVGLTLFVGLKNLFKVDLNSNICVSKLYEGTAAITQLRCDIPLYCKNPNYENGVKLFEMSTKLVTLNDMMTQLLKTSDDQKNDQIEINKLRTELSDSKDDQKNKEIAMNKLNKELLEAYQQRQIDQHEINELRTKFTKTNELWTDCTNDQMNCRFLLLKCLK